MIIACDFDDVLCSRKPEPGYRMGVPEPGAVASVRKLVAQGHTIIIFTARNVQDPRVKKVVADWLDYFKIPFSGISNIKSPAYDLIIDNRAIQFTQWAGMLTRIEKFGIMQKSK